MPQTLLDVKNLTKKYGSNVAVNKINFQVRKNEIFSLVGHNGAGKSTTLKMIATILKPTSGTIHVDGLDTTKDPELARDHISYLPEEAGAYKNLSGKNYLTFMASIFAHTKEQKKEYIDFAVEMTGLGDRLKDKVKTYSKGMKRKLLLARTIMSRPKLVILDEPTSGLDVLNAFDIRNTIRELAKQGTSVILSSHNMLETEFLSDRIGIISKGDMLAIGTARQLKKKYKTDDLEKTFITAMQGHIAKTV